MAELNCNACEEIRQTSPEFVVNGLTDDMCTSLQNDTGLSTTDSNTTCTDLHNLNDCLVGNMSNEIETYDVCDWKEFMRNFIPNVWTTLKASICSICGMWKAIHRLECLVDVLYNGVNFRIKEDPTADSFVVAGQGVSFFETGQTDLSGDISIGAFGGMGIWTGSVIIHHTDFQDEKACANLDNNSYSVSKNRKGDSSWGNAGKPQGGSQLLYEVRMKNSAFPQVKAMSTGRGMNATGGAFHAMFTIFREGEWAHGIYGQCHPTTGEPANASSSRGHHVPDGWTYLQCRITYLDLAFGDGVQRSPKGWFGIKLDQGEVDCENGYTGYDN